MERVKDDKGRPYTLTEGDQELLRSSIAIGVFFGMWLFTITAGGLSFLAWWVWSSQT